MGQKEYDYEDLNSLDDKSLSTVLSSCPYGLLALVLKATPEAMQERMLGLLGGHKKQLVLEDFQQLDLEKLNVPHDSIREEVEAAQRTIVRSARVLLEDGQIQLAE
jgi:flagellar motor switch protein FliG